MTRVAETFLVESLSVIVPSRKRDSRVILSLSISCLRASICCCRSRMRRMSVSVESSTVLVFSGVKVITVLDVIASEFDAVIRDLSVCPGVEIVVVINDFHSVEGNGLDGEVLVRACR